VTLSAGSSIPGGAPGTCTVTVNVTAALGGSYLNTLPAGALQTSNGNNAAPAIATLTVNSSPPSLPIPPPSAVSDDKPGSVLIFNLYTSSLTAPNSQNTRINLTNTNTKQGVAVHLFFVDGSTCSVADAFMCLTPNQTASFLASDLDPGVTGFLVAVAVNPVTGCPINFNFLIGDAFAKFASGHAANLGAEAVSAVAPTPVTCAATADTATLAFNGTAYGRLPRVLAADSIGSVADGNSTLVVINRIGGSLITGIGNIGTIFGVLFDDIETGISFSIPFSGCQRNAILSDSLPRTTPRFSSFIPQGRTGGAKFWVGSADNAITGAEITFNPNTATNPGTFNGGHNLHKLTLTAAATLDIPIFTARCF